MLRWVDIHGRLFLLWGERERKWGGGAGRTGGREAVVERYSKLINKKCERATRSHHTLRKQVAIWWQEIEVMGITWGEHNCHPSVIIVIPVWLTKLYPEASKKNKGESSFWGSLGHGSCLSSLGENSGRKCRSGQIISVYPKAMVWVGLTLATHGLHSENGFHF